MRKAKFNYPRAFKTLPVYTAHSGQVVDVVRQLTEEEADQGNELERMFLVIASDGWEGHAFESELEYSTEEPGKAKPA